MASRVLLKYLENRSSSPGGEAQNNAKTDKESCRRSFPLQMSCRKQISLTRSNNSSIFCAKGVKEKKETTGSPALYVAPYRKEMKPLSKICPLHTGPLPRLQRFLQAIASLCGASGEFCGRGKATMIRFRCEGASAQPFLGVEHASCVVSDELELHRFVACVCFHV
jgi:hypothetical protein